MSRPIRVLELRSVRGTGGGPEKTILSGAALADPARYAITVCYVRDLRDPVFSMDERAAALPVDYVEVRERHSFDFAIWSSFRRVVRSRQIDIVHSHDYKTNLYAWLLGRAEPIVPLATLHGYTGSSRRELLYYAADKRIVRRFPRLIAVSGDLKSELVRTGSKPERIVTLPNGIDDRLFVRDDRRRAEARRAFGLAPDDVVIGAVGRLESQKRFDLLMQAIAALRERRGRESLRLVVAGDGSQREALEVERDRLGLHDVCHFVGHQGDIALAHHAFDLFVQSSVYEGTPNSVLEAMAMETPIVATDVGGTRELVSDGVHALVIPPRSVDALVSAVERVLDDAEATRRRTRAARLRVEGDLSFRKRMAAVEAVYESLMLPRAQPGASHALRRA